MTAILRKRPVLATFKLTEPELDYFLTFYQTNPTDILSLQQLDISKRNLEDKLDEYSVIFTSFDESSMQFMNMWGVKWVDNGFFRVKNANILKM